LLSLQLILAYQIFNSGEATRKGFYKYEGKRKATPDPEITKYIEKSRSMAGVTTDPEVWLLHHVIIHALLLCLKSHVLGSNTITS
jgi:enoyl-CoA hydratase/3-hydroxyacyl-CoA dehydrogenase